MLLIDILFDKYSFPNFPQILDLAYELFGSDDYIDCQTCINYVIHGLPIVMYCWVWIDFLNNSWMSP